MSECNDTDISISPTEMSPSADLRPGVKGQRDLSAVVLRLVWATGGYGIKAHECM